MRSTTVAIVCATLCAAWSASAARADIVHFINPAPGQPGHFDWRWGAPWSPGHRLLDITLGPADQSNTSSGSSVAQYGLSSWLETTNYTWGGAAVAVFDDNFWGRYTRALGAGDTIPGSAFHSHSLHYYSNSEQPDPPWGVSFFPEGERRYIGVLTADGRYGWIEVELTGVVYLTAHSWAYETVPGVPILAGQVPAPGAAVLLGLGTVSLRRRRS